MKPHSTKFEHHGKNCRKHFDCAWCETHGNAGIPIAATVSDPGGTVTNVAFYDGPTLLGATNNSPYTVTATFAAGNHALTAAAADNAF